jgi:hypothetical protein
MFHEFRCRPFSDRIQSNLPRPLDQRLLDRIADLTDSDPNFPRILNYDLRPVIQHVCVSSPNGPTSSVFISGISYALDIYPQFITPVNAVFSRGRQSLPIPPGDIQETIKVILAQNETL